MNENIETKQVAYHVLSALAAHHIIELRPREAKTVLERHVQELKNVTQAESLIRKELSGHMDSHLGAYEMAATIAVMLSAGWVRGHEEALKGNTPKGVPMDSDEAIRVKDQLNGEICGVLAGVAGCVAGKEKDVRPGAKGETQDFVSMGFRAGIRVAAGIKDNGDYLSGDVIVATLQKASTIKGSIPCVRVGQGR